MTDERIKELMNQVGFHQSHSIKELILQVENETAQECHEICRVAYQPILCGRIAEKFGLDK